MLKKIFFICLVIENYFTFALPNKAGIAQLVEHDLAKVGVAGSSPVSRSVKKREACLGKYRGVAFPAKKSLTFICEAFFLHLQ